MYPMLLSAGPILGSGRLIGFTDKKRVRVWVAYRSNTLFYGSGDTDLAPVRIPDFSPAPAVAVLTGPHTASSGEAVAIAFRGRPQTRSFGATTAGATTSPSSYRLADGATIESRSCWTSTAAATSTGARSNLTSSRPPSAEMIRPYRVAKRWLRSTPAMQPHH
jgi:hypothetical protein